MSAFVYKEVRLFCNRCNRCASEEFDLSDMTVSQARKLLKMFGWKSDRGQDFDFCPACA